MPKVKTEGSCSKVDFAFSTSAFPNFLKSNTMMTAFCRNSSRTTRSSFDNRPSILFPSFNHIVKRSEYYDRPRDKTTVIHVLSVDRLLRRPKAEEYHDDHVHARVRVRRNAKISRHPPRAPHQVSPDVVDRVVIGVVAVRLDFTCAAAVKQERRRE